MSCPFSLENVKFRETAHMAFEDEYVTAYQSIDIRIERLQDISEEDCLAEGIVDFESRINKAHFYSITDESATYGTAKKPYSLLIDKIAGKGTWKRNPYVFVYEFGLINHPLWD